jgi:methionyl-tRNA synthetase
MDTFKGTKLSESRGNAVEVPYFLSKYDPDLLRFYLTATAPETRDTEACPERSRRACPE